MSARTARRGLAAAIPAVAGAAVLAVMPAAPASSHLWLPLCSGGDTHWIAIPITPGKPGRDDRQHVGCAHFNCPRETKLARKARLT